MLEETLHRGRDAVGVDAGGVQQLGRLARSRHIAHREVLPRERGHTAALGACVEHGLTDASFGPMVLDYYEAPAGRLDSPDETGSVDRLDAVQVDDAHLHAVLRERIGRLHRL